MRQAEGVIAGKPLREVDVPAAVHELALGRPISAVWKNELGGLTFQIGVGPGRWFVKWAPAESGIDLNREAERLVWAARWTPVPRLLDRGADPDGSWIVTAGLGGETAVADRWKADPAAAVKAIGLGLRQLHEALPVGACPYSWSARERVPMPSKEVSAAS